jgi:hypothetical protein
MGCLAKYQHIFFRNIQTYAKDIQTTTHTTFCEISQFFVMTDFDSLNRFVHFCHTKLHSDFNYSEYVGNLRYIVINEYYFY